MFERAAILISLFFPAFLLTVNGSMGVLFFLLLILSVACLYRMRQSRAIQHWDEYSIAFTLAMSSPVIAIFLSQAYHGNFDAQYYDWASRFLFSIPIFLALRQINISTVNVLQYSIPLGALVTFAALKLHPFIWLTGGHTTSEAFNLIHFSDTALILGFLSLFSINWERKDPALVLTLKLCGFLAGIYMSIQSGQRGGWIAIPPLLLLWVIAHSGQRLWFKFAITMLVLLSAIWLSYATIDFVHYRIDMIANDLRNYAHGNKDTSIGVRLQLWQAALHLFFENPFFGAGPGGFAQAMPALNASGMLTPEAARLGNAEVHNEILAKCASTGLFGLASILSIYLVPMFIFWRATKSSSNIKRSAGFMGICLVLGFFIFGLTVEIFDLIMTAAFFSLTLAILMAAATHKSIK